MDGIDRGYTPKPGDLMQPTPEELEVMDSGMVNIDPSELTTIAKADGLGDTAISGAAVEDGSDKV
ncbi:hypothetical protein KDA00_04630 [Candidatus Saccharibacteria bacterium]|nr:hypothetical protein [Candidatus Saccharibacteria bacterium]